MKRSALLDLRREPELTHTIWMYPGRDRVGLMTDDPRVSACTCQRYRLTEPASAEP